MDTVGVILELKQLFRDASGISPDTNRWADSVDKLFERGCNPQQIIQAAKFGLANQFHRAKLLDAGPRYIEWRMNELISSGGPRTKIVRAEDRVYEGYRHQRWEAELHRFSETLTDEDDHYKARRNFVENFMNINGPRAYEVIECDSCRRVETERAEKIEAKKAADWLANPMVDWSEVA